MRLQVGLAKFLAVIRTLVFSLLILSLVSCSPTVCTPLSPQLVQKALTLQLAEAQEQLNQQLTVASRPNSVRVHRVIVSQQTLLNLNELTIYRVQGVFDATFRLSKKRVKRGIPFELWLMPQKEGKTWRLVHSDRGAVSWQLSQPIY